MHAVNPNARRRDFVPGIRKWGSASLCLWVPARRRFGAMREDRFPGSKANARQSCWQPPGGFTPWLAAIVGGAGGLYIFLIGFRLVAAQSRPGGVACGNCLWGGVFDMVLLAPLAAMVLAVVGGGIGFLLDEMMS